MPKGKSGPVWNHFSILDDDAKKAECNYCIKTLSYKTTTTNLKTHLKQKHFLVYEEMCKSQNDLNDLTDHDSQNKDSDDVWGYFAQLSNDRVQCISCDVTLPNHSEEVRNHLRDKHPKNPISDQDSDRSDVEDEKEQTYTEVVYLEDESPKKYSGTIPKQSAKIPKKQPSPKRTVEKRRRSNSSDNFPLQKKLKTDELEIFTSYLKCLLSDLPKDKCSKVQMDIINLVMTTKLKTDHKTVILAPNEINMKAVEARGIHNNATAEEFFKNNTNDRDSKKKDSQDVWAFTHLSDDQMQCISCEVTLPNKSEELTKHLREKHPKVPTRDQDSDADVEEDKEQPNTEIVYLDDELSKRTSRIISKQSAKIPKKQPSKISAEKRPRSTSSDDVPLQKKFKAEELEIFTSYLKCLLSDLPKDICSKLQMDIINLVMISKLKSGRKKVTSAPIQINMKEVEAVETHNNGTESQIIVVTATTEDSFN